MKATRPVNWAARCNLARSVLNQREPSERTAVVARMALAGRSVEYIRLYEADIDKARDGAA